MSITLTINGNSSLLVAKYFPSIDLKQDYVWGLISFDTYNSIPNIDVENNLFHIGDNIINIPVGSYELADIASTISDLYEATNKGFVDIKANYNTLQTEIMSHSEKIYFDKPNSIGTLLGFSKRVLEPKITYTSDNPISITKINTISIECNIITGSYINEAAAHTIHQFTLRVGSGYKITDVPANVIYLPVNIRQISSLVIKINH